MKKAPGDSAATQFPNKIHRVGRLFHSPELISFTITASLLAVQLFFIRPYYLVNDDIFKVLMARGIGVNSTPQPYFLYSNILLGFLFKQLGAWFPSLPLYGWFLLAVQFLSLWSFLWLLCLKSPGEFHKLLFILSAVGVQFIFFTYLQFTITSLMAAGAGFLLLYFLNEPFWRDRRPWARFVGGALLLVSWLIRSYGLLEMLLVTAPLFFYRIHQVGFNGFFRGQWRFFLTLTSLMFIATSFDWGWLEKNQDWKAFEEFNDKASQFLIYNNVEYSPETKPVFDSVGWSENDLWLFKNWYWMDEEKLNIPNLRKIENQIPPGRPSGRYASFRSWRELVGSFWDRRILLCFLVFALLGGRKAAGFLFAQSLWVGLAFLFLVNFLRATDRVTLPVLAFLMSLAIFYAEEPVFPHWKGRFAAAHFLLGLRVSLLVLAMGYAFVGLKAYYGQNLERKAVEAQVRDCLQRLKPSDQQLYIMWGFPFELFSDRDNFECFRPMRMFTTSFIQRSPATLESLERFGIKDIFKDAVDNPNIFMVCTPEQGVHYAAYIEEHFHKTIYAQRVFNCDYFKVFSIHSRKGA